MKWPTENANDFYSHVHYILAYGSYQECLALVKKHGVEKIKKEFLKSKPGIYSRAALGFAILLLQLDEDTIDAKQYIKDVRGSNIR